jgi:hypothetical protein
MRAARLRVLVDHELSGLHNFLDLFKQFAKISIQCRARSSINVHRVGPARMHGSFDSIQRGAPSPKICHLYNEVRTHVSLGKDAPYTRPIQRFGGVARIRSLAAYIIGTLKSRFRKRQR